MAVAKRTTTEIPTASQSDGQEGPVGSAVRSVSERCAIGAIRVLSLFLLWISPWYYGGATWSFQYLLFYPACVLAVALGIFSVVSRANRPGSGLPPVPAWILLFLGVFAQIQSVRTWDIDSQTARNLPSVQMQRMALGIVSDATEKCDLDSIGSEHRKLALSVEPLSTQGASSSLFLCGLLIWGASVVWGHRKAYPSLLLGLVLLGILVGGFGVVGAFFRSKPNLLGLFYGSSFSVFVSKNSAGAFLNITLAAALGLAVWKGEKIYSAVDRQLRSRDTRQWPSNAKFQYCLKTAFEKLDPSAVLSVLSVLLLAFCVAISLCRGAFISAIVALMVSVAVAWPGRRRSALLLGCFVAMVTAVVAMASLQLDQTSLNRIESIENFDVELEKQTGRLYIWGVASRAAMHYGWLGSGLGTFHVAALPFQVPSSEGWYYHAESLVAETVVTLGFLGSLAALVALLVSVRCLLGIYHTQRFREYLPLEVAGVFFLASQALHACIDFAWILPGVYVPSALFLGAILGGFSESQRAYRRIENIEVRQPSRSALNRNALLGIGFAALSLLFLLSNQRAVSVLAFAERMEKELRFEGAPRTAQGDALDYRPLVERWVDSSAEAYSSDPSERVSQSSTLLRLLANSIVYDTRVDQWEKRPANAPSDLAWSQTSPVVMRLALESASEPQRAASDRASVIESIGGSMTLDRLSRANYWYTRGQLLSPLDWRLSWGRLSTALECTPEQLKPLVPVFAATSSHAPSNLTSCSLLLHSVLSEQERLDLWQRAVRADRKESIPIARVMTGMYLDGQIPIETFPEDPQVLRKLYNEVFTQTSYPATHELLADRLVEASSKVPWTGLRKSTWMADIARETGRSDLEIENLTIILGLDRSNVPLLKRLVKLLIEAGQKDKARSTLRQLIRAAPSDPAIDSFNQQLAGMEP